MSLHNMRTMKKKRKIIWKLNEGIMYLFEETQGIKNFSILQKLKEKFFNPPKNSKRIFRLHENSNQKISNPAKIQIKNFQSYENSNLKFSILRKFKIKIFYPPQNFFGIFPRDPKARSEVVTT